MNLKKIGTVKQEKEVLNSNKIYIIDKKGVLMYLNMSDTPIMQNL